MKVPEIWLREFCDPKITLKEMIQTLTMSGLEVEECNDFLNIENLIVAQIQLLN